MRSHYLICYDIAEPKRLRRVHKFMKGKGIHIQYSVFYCSLSWQELLTIKEKLRRLIEEEEDDVRIYPLPSGYKVIVMGQGARVPEGVEIFIE